MKISKKAILISILCLHLIGIFLIVYKQNIFVTLSFEQQKLEKKYEDLLKEKQQLTTHFLLLQDKSKIKEFAQNSLGMGKMKLEQLRNLVVNE